MRGSLFALMLALAAPLFAQQPGAMPAAPAAPAATLTDIAVLYTGERPGAPVRLEAWEPPGPALGARLGERIDYVLVEPAPIVIENGARMPLASLRVSAFGLNGGWVAGAPLKLSLEAPAGVLSADLAVGSRSLLALGPGYARLWVEALLPRGTGTGEHYRVPVVILVR